MKRDDSGNIIRFPELPRPAVSVILWEGKGLPDEVTLRAQLAQEGYHALKWTSEPDQVYVAHAHIYPELLWLLTGSMTVFLVAEKRLLELGPGDRIEVPPGMMHAVLAGPDGAAYLMATHVSAG